MPKPLPDQASADLTAPDAAEVELISRGVVTAVTPSGGLTETQLLLLRAVFVAMTGFPATVDAPELDPGGLAEGLARRTIEFRTRIVQIMILLGLVLRPIPVEVADRITAYARELCVEDGMLEVARSFAEGSLELAALDFDRNGYTSTRDAGATSALHTSRRLDSAWDLDLADDSLAERWQSLERYADNSLGRRLTDFYRARGFTYPGRPGSAPPLLAQHDCGTTVEAELEVFAFIARANDDLRAFSLLAMVVSLFETGYLRAGAGLFESDPGHLSHAGMAARLADAMRRGALCDGSVDFMGLDWFDLAALPVDEARRHFGVPPKSLDAIRSGSVGPWEPGGISAFQVRSGTAFAEQEGRAYESFGAFVSPEPR
jgi:hypothetical protein